MSKLFKNNFKDKIIRFLHKSIYKPGHYYSAVPDPDEIDKRRKQIFASDIPLNGINLNEKKQIDFISNCNSYFNDFPYFKSNESLRYNTINNFFPVGDALALYLMIRNYKPKKIIEVGSGYSSAVMIDVNDLFFNSAIKLDFIEPYPDRLKSLLKENEKSSIIHENFVQDISLSFFNTLDENDILFIDSSHVSKIGSDVNYLFFNVLPNLKKGVVIHIHDITYPFEYSEQFVDYGIYWNEAYLLRAFLLFNDSFEIILWNDFLNKNKKQELININSYFENISGGSIWLRKIK